MEKRIYISADYADGNGDREVVELLTQWGKDELHKVSFVDTAQVENSISNNPNCRACDLKREFNERINWSSIVVIIIGDRTRLRLAGNRCNRLKSDFDWKCTPYKQNSNGKQLCKVRNLVSCLSDTDVCVINEFSFIRHEYEQAKWKNKQLVILYNSSRNEYEWLPDYMKESLEYAHPFWVIKGEKPDYNYIKNVLGF